MVVVWPGRLEQDRTTRGAVGLRDVGELVGDHRAQLGLVAEDRVELLDGPLELVVLLVELELENLVSRRSGMSRM